MFNSGTINAAAGFAAIELCGCGSSTLTLGPGSVINGLVLGGGAGTFQLGGAGKDTFNLSLIGAGQQYDGFTTFNKVDSSNWTVTGTGAQDWNVLGGTLSVNGSIAGSAVHRECRRHARRQRHRRQHHHQRRHAGARQFDRPADGERQPVVHRGVVLPGRSLGRECRPHQCHGHRDARRRDGQCVVSLAGSYVVKQYTILNATGGLGGSTFESVVNTNLPSGFKSSLSYDANNAYLNLALNFTAPPGGLNGNQQNVGNALTNFFNRTGGIPLVFGALTPAGLTQVSRRDRDRIAAGHLRRDDAVHGR